MKKTVLATLIATTIASAPAFAGVAEELAAMKERIAQLESQLAQQQASIAKQETALAKQETTSGAGGFADNVTVSGEVALLAQQIEADDGTSTGDVLVDTFELAIEADINENVKVATLIEYLAADEKLDLAEAYAVIGAEDSPVHLTVGKAAHPLLVGDSAAFTDPIAFDLYDAKEGLAMVSYSNEMVNVDAYVLNTSGETGEALDTLGVNLGVALANGVSFGAGYITNTADVAGPFADLDGMTEKVDAWRANALFETGNLSLFAEYIQLGDINPAGQEPSFLHLGAGYDTQIFGADGNLFLGYSESDEANNIDDLPETRTALGLSRSLGENASVVTEYVREESYSNEDTDILNVAIVTEF